MGCFVGCFGLSSRRKRRKPPNHQRYVTYRPLPSSDFHTTVKPLSLDFDNSGEKRSIKIGKKVSFNLNVETYEPIQNTYNASESDKEENKEETIPLSQLKSTIQTTVFYPSNYRYQNCTDFYDEDDEIAYEESDLEEDDEDDDEYDCGSDIDEQRLDEQELGEYLCDSTDGDLKSIGRVRSHYVRSVLNPVENLAQWKAIKARAAPPKYQRKENIPIQQESVMGTKTSLSPLPCDSAINTNPSKPLLQEAAVDASLSNWLALSNSHQSLATSKGSRVSDQNMSFSWKTRSNDLHSQRSREGAILDITNLEIK